MAQLEITKKVGDEDRKCIIQVDDGAVQIDGNILMIVALSYQDMDTIAETISYALIVAGLITSDAGWGRFLPFELGMGSRYRLHKDFSARIIQ